MYITELIKDTIGMDFFILFVSTIIIIMIVNICLKLMWLSFVIKYITNNVIDILQEREIIKGKPKEDYREDVETAAERVEREKEKKKIKKIIEEIEREKEHY